MIDHLLTSVNLHNAGNDIQVGCCNAVLKVILSLLAHLCTSVFMYSELQVLNTPIL